MLNLAKEDSENCVCTHIVLSTNSIYTIIFNVIQVPHMLST